MIAPFTIDLDDERTKRLSFNLMNAPLILSDEHRDYDMIWKMLIRDQKAAVPMYELAPWLGMIAVRDIVPSYRARLDCWIWDKTIYHSQEFEEEMPSLMQNIMDGCQAYRLTVETPQEELANWLKNFGFKVEGRQKYGFKWNGKMITKYLLRRIKEV